MPTPADSSADFSRLSYLGFGLTGVSDNVFMGRHDSLAVPYLTPQLTLHLRNGLFVTASASYSPQHGRIDLGTLEGGWERERADYNCGASLSKYFYNASSTVIRSAVSADLNAYGEYTGWLIAPKATLDALFGTQNTDWAISLGVSHNFLFERAGIAVQPSATAWAGTQHFYNNYLARKATKKKATELVSVTNAERFRVLDYQLSVPVQWERGRWQLTLTPFYDVPVNAAALTVAKKKLTEQLSNVAWVQVDALWRLPLKHRKAIAP